MPRQPSASVDQSRRQQVTPLQLTPSVDSTIRQQEDSDGQQETRRQQNTESHRMARLDPIRRQQQQAINTAARRRVRHQDPHRRLHEQIRDTAARRRVREDNPQHSAQEQQANNARRQQVRASRQANFRALNYQPENFVNNTSVGLLNKKCSNCGALKFSKESEGFCGNVNLDLFPQPPPFLQRLYEGIGSDSNHFLSNIRKYNCAFQMTSFGCNEVTMAGFNPSFRIQGQVYHLLGSMLPTAGESPKFAQIYFIDNRESEVAARCAIVNGLRPDIVSCINELPINENRYVEIFKLAKEIFEQQDSPPNIKIVINENRRPSGEHSRRYNSPVSDEIAVLMPNDNTNNRDVVLHYRDGGLRHISELHRSYDPLQYPLLFPSGTDGWHVNLKLQNGKKLTALVYYRYHIMVKQSVSALLKAKRLFQQFLVDAYFNNLLNLPAPSYL